MEVRFWTIATRRLAIVLIMLAAMAIAGCGAVDDAKDKVNNTARGELSKQCLKRAMQVEDRGDRRSAIRACRAVRRGDSRSVQEEFGRRCLQRAVKISDPDLRRKATGRCKAILAGGK